MARNKWIQHIPIKKLREYISCLRPPEHWRDEARIQINVQAIKGCICFCLRAISASCTRTVRQDKPPDATVKSSQHISHYRLLFTASTPRDTANGFLSLLSLQSFIAIFFCVLPLIHASCARHILRIIRISWELFNAWRGKSEVNLQCHLRCEDKANTSPLIILINTVMMQYSPSLIGRLFFYI